jgi:hypothetical protein
MGVSVAPRASGSSANPEMGEFTPRVRSMPAGNGRTTAKIEQSITEEARPSTAEDFAGGIPLWVRYCLPGYLPAMSTAEGEAAETVGKRTYAALTAGLGPTAVVPHTGAGRRIIATS